MEPQMKLCRGEHRCGCSVACSCEYKMDVKIPPQLCYDTMVILCDITICMCACE